MDELVRNLVTGTHELSAARSKSPEELRQAIERGYVLVKFTQTRGGTELGVRLDRSRSSTGNADFASGTGAVKLVGTLVLNYNEVELTADIALDTLQGSGALKLLKDEPTYRAAREAQDVRA